MASPCILFRPGCSIPAKPRASLVCLSGITVFCGSLGLRTSLRHFPEAMTCPCSWRPFKGGPGGLKGLMWPAKEGSLLSFVSIFAFDHNFSPVVPLEWQHHSAASRSAWVTGKSCSHGKIQRVQRRRVPSASLLIQKIKRRSALFHPYCWS
ncbi:spermatogenesis-associated protein 8-like isoform X2 [Trachypithecus francoisi]|uniref:spermatogenesis-associated protein 8-like isoform X2 n=1 Tax=Trachypithecus francoisi TaxID=54180 RepID=UPI00141B5D7F|nr:spermatogenesis-associated protein 8-like isoform X2 [Trachypithecus francoisi]